MEQRRLGRTDLRVSRICLGTMTWGQQNTEADGHEQIDFALAHGVNFLDTAELYSIPPKAETHGSTERIIGSWIARTGRRDEIVLASKVVGRTAMEWFRGGRPSRLVRADIMHAINGSLQRLRTDCIDLYQIHFPDRQVPWGANPSRIGRWPILHDEDETPIEETLGVFDELVKAGKIRHLGLSNESSWGVMRYLGAAESGRGPRVASIQNAYNLVNRTFETNLAETCGREQIGLLAYSPLAQGYLTGKYDHGARPEGARTTLFSRGQRYETPYAADALLAYNDLARSFGVDPALFAGAFVVNQPFVASSIIGATSIAQLDTAIAAADFDWTTEMQAAVDDLHQKHGNPCP